MKKNNLAGEYSLIFLCARLNINKPIRNEIRNLLNGPLNWDKIQEISIHHEILTFLYYNLNRLNLQNLIPEKIFALMKNYHYSNLIRNSLLEKEVALILKSSGSAGITIIPFKGFSLIQTLYRGNPELRIMADVDILVKETEFPKIKNILLQTGYTENTDPAENKIIFETVFSKKLSANLSSIIEIHTALSPARPHPVKLPQLWERTREITINGQKIPLLSAEDTFLSLTLHLRRHLRRLTLKFIVDISELLSANGENLDWNYIKKSAQDNHIITTVYLSLYAVKELLDLPVPAKILDEFRPNIIKSALISLAINKHNFFTLKKRQAVFLRFLLFDRLLDFCLYLWRVSFIERFIAGRTLKKTKINTIPRIPIKNIVETRK
ncbi:MAG: nucleotidyltransferase family protein [Candidatus Omnitrophica bacterium]|nr:nucleotidyltransferase family protein [Candidatus Omnitrophota bacterium]MBU4468312.1 nucleotidyltransferase family protein [Candidatus Omnitrophota bacterium]MCG2707279.1 nucleotidyltransferase family protein [Candidatus Omnitrophota bacterium]